MGNFDLDFSLVHKTLYKDPNKIPVEGNEHRMVRVAFDLFRLKDDEREDLWQIQADDDGEFLVRTYSLPDEEDLTASDWSVKEDEKHANLTVAYKGIPIQRLAGADFGATTPEDTTVLRGIVFEKLASDGEFVLDFIASLSNEKREILKEAGIWEKVKDWLTSKDITDEVAAAIEKAVNTNSSDYKKYFRDKAEEYGAPSGDPQDVPAEKRDEFFEDVDEGWKAENECGEGIPLDLAALELELRLKEAVAPPPLPPDLQFDFSDVDANKEQEEPETFLADEDKINEIIKEIEQLGAETKEALKQ